MSKQEVDIQLIKMGKTKRWLLSELQKSGFIKLQESSLSGILSGARVGPMADAVLKTIPIILDREFNKSKER